MTICELNPNNTLTDKKCLPCEGGVLPLEISQIKALLKQLSGWEYFADADQIKYIQKKFIFKNYYHTIAFVNAVAYLAHRENHHPDLTVSYNHCIISYSTHAIKGLSENDFICAAKVEQLFQL